MQRTARVMAVVAAAAAMTLALAGRASAADWPWWRGPERVGVAAPGTALATHWPGSGPVRVWESEPIPSIQEGGFGSVSVVGPRAYVYVNWKAKKPIITRTLREGPLRQIGWFPETVPADLLQAVEAARNAPERAALAKDAVKPWVDRWVAEHLGTNAAAKRFELIVRGRLMRGANALPLDVAAKLAPLKDREFANAGALEAWCASNAIPADVRRQITSLAPSTVDTASDVVLCLDRATGKTVWKREFPGVPSTWGSSSSPAVADGRVIVSGARTLYAFQAKDGRSLWEVPLKGNEISSSPLLVGSLAVVLGGPLTAVSVADGKPAWQQPKVSGNNGSAMPWTAADGVTHVIANGGSGLACVATNDGRILWTAPGGGSSTPVVQGDTVVLFSGSKTVGLVAYRMTPAKAEKLWSCEITDRGSTPVVSDGYIYAVGGGQAVCLRLADGHAMWTTLQHGEITSPVMADGKIVASVDGGKALILFRASPDGYAPLARAAIPHASCTSPSLADGWMFLRLADRIACYDLTRGAP